MHVIGKKQKREVEETRIKRISGSGMFIYKIKINQN